MSDIEISSGPGVAVNTAALEEAASRIEALCRELDTAREDLRSCVNGLLASGSLSDTALLWTRLAISGLDCDIDSGAELAEALRTSSVQYRLAELQNQLLMGALTGNGLQSIIALDELTRLFEIGRDRFPWERGLLDTQLAATLAMLSLFGIGVPHGAPTPGATAPRLRVEPVSQHVQPPRTLEEVTARIPRDGDPRVRIERYQQADGTLVYFAYVGGTATFAFSDSEPWDMTSNTALYSGRESDSLLGVEAALIAAGAKPGDTVNLAGFSAGGAIAAALMAKSTYNSQLVTLAGSPIMPPAREGTIAVDMRHEGDPVSAIAPTNADEFENTLVTRDVGNEMPGNEILGTGINPDAHNLQEYTKTAAAADASGDPRIEDAQDVLAQLPVGTLGEASEYRFERQ